MTVKELMKFLEERMNEDFGKTPIGYIRDGKFYALCGFIETRNPKTVALGFKDNYSAENAMTARDLYNAVLHNTGYNPNDIHDMPYMMDPQAKIVDEAGNSILNIECSDNIIINFQSNIQLTYEVDETKMYKSMLELGITVDMVRKCMGDIAADHMQRYCEDHGLN